MTVEIGGVAGDALAAASNSRGNQTTVRRVMAGSATLWRMDLTATDKGRSGGADVATDTVHRGWAGEHVFLDLGAVVMGVVGKVARMAGRASAAIATIDRGVAMIVYADDASAVFRGVTVGAVILMHAGDCASSVAADAERGGENRSCVAVGVAGEICGVATGASPSCDGGDVVLVGRISQGRGGSVTETAVVLVDHHRVIGRVAGPDTGGGVGDQVSGRLTINDDGGMVHGAMLTCLIMTGQATGGVDACCDDLLYGYAGGGSCRSGFIVTLGAGVFMEVKDAGPGVATSQLGVADIARLTLGQIDAGPQADRMFNTAAGAMVMAVKIAGMAADAFACGA